MNSHLHIATSVQILNPEAANTTSLRKHVTKHQHLIHTETEHAKQ